MKCANCENDALFEYKLTQTKSIFYCQKHLPKFLDSRKRADLLTLTETFSELKEEAISLLTTESEVEKPKKKAAKKKAE